MRRVLLGGVFALAGLSVHAAESDMTVVGGFDIAMKTLTLDVADGNSFFQSDFTSVAPYIGIGYGKFYGTFSIDKSTGAQPTPINDNDTSASTLQHSRTDTILTFGYRATSAISVFGGYTVGENSFLQTGFDFETGPAPDPMDPPVSGCEPGGSGLMCGLEVQDITYEERGPFLGLSYTKSLESGSLSFSAAYATLKGELTMKRRPNTSDSDSIEGDTSGLSYGLTWIGPLSESLSYRLGYKKTRYELDTRDSEIKEDYSSFFFGISNYF